MECSFVCWPAQQGSALLYAHILRCGPPGVSEFKMLKSLPSLRPAGLAIEKAATMEAGPPHIYIVVSNRADRAEAAGSRDRIAVRKVPLVHTCLLSDLVGSGFGSVVQHRKAVSENRECLTCIFRSDRAVSRRKTRMPLPDYVQRAIRLGTAVFIASSIGLELISPELGRAGQGSSDL